MVCTVKVYEKPKLENPVLLEGLPGIGFVANIAALHLIRELNAKAFAEIHSSAFQDLAVTMENLFTSDGGLVDGQTILRNQDKSNQGGNKYPLEFSASSGPTQVSCVRPVLR